MEQLHTLGSEEQRLRPRFERGSTLVLEDEAMQDLAEWCLVRSDGDDLMPLLSQRTGQRRDLRAFAGSVETLE